MYSPRRTSRLFFGSDGFLNRGHTVTAEPQANEVEQWTGDQPNTRKDRRRLMSGALLQSGIHARGEGWTWPSTILPARPRAGGCLGSHSGHVLRPVLVEGRLFCARLTAFSLARNHARWAALSGLVSGRQSVASMSVARRSQRCAVSTRVSLKSGFGASAAIAKQRWAFSRNSLGSPGMLCLLRNPPVPGIDSKREYWSRVKADWPRHGYEAPRANAREGSPRRSPGRGPGLVPHLRRVRVTVVSAFTAVNKRPPRTTTR